MVTRREFLLKTLSVTAAGLSCPLKGWGGPQRSGGGGVAAKSEFLWKHLTATTEWKDARGISASFHGIAALRTLRLKVVESTPRHNLAWIGIPVPQEGWGLDRAEAVQATIRNTGPNPTETMLWVIGSNGWSAVGVLAKLEPGESRRFVCDLRETFPDGTPKINPVQVNNIRIMVKEGGLRSSLEISDLVATGAASEWVLPANRMEVPNLEYRLPAAGRRVRYLMNGDEGTGIYSVLYLPPEWDAGGTYPVIVEFPGNVFYHPALCYSTGHPEQCVIGYGMTKGQKAIWVSLPFVDQVSGSIVENGFGQADDTTNYALRVIDLVCREFGGDRENMVITGFSRGAIACGYIGLRNDTIAPLWKGIHACQHYDGSSWRESNIEGAIERAPRFSGKAIFQTDNDFARYKPVVDATDPEVEWTWAKSGLGFHDTAMFLDNRPSTLQLREWYRDLIAAS